VDIYYLKNLIELLSKVAIFLGVPVTIIKYFSLVKEQKLRYLYQVYNELDNKYIDFQKLCLDYPFLNIFEVSDTVKVDLTDIQKKQELIAYTILISIFERAHFMCHFRNNKVDLEHWFVWNDLMERYCCRLNFVGVWKKVREIWDKSFIIDMDKRIRANGYQI